MHNIYYMIPILIQNSRGQSNKGVEISKSFIEKLVTSKTKSIDIISASTFKNCVEGTRAVYEKCLLSLQRSKQNVFIGGDHYSSFGTVLASLKLYGKNLRLVWIDAHTDIHSFETSPSKNMHGMVVRFLMTHDYPDIPRLHPNQLLYIGIRSVEKEEFEFIHRNHIKTVWMEEFDKDKKVAYEKINGFLKNHPVHISLDVDVLDPDYMVSTGTPDYENEGMTPTDLFATIRVIQKGGHHFATDIMEFHPNLGTAKEKILSTETFRKILLFFGL